MSTERPRTVTLIWPTDIARQSALYPPLGLASLAAVMQRKGYGVRVMDLSFDKTWEQVRTLEPSGGIYGISLTSSLYENTRRCMVMIRDRDPGARIVLGGPHPSVLPEETLEDLGPEAVCIGEAEETFPALVEALERGGDLGTVPGIAFREPGGGMVRTPEPERIPDLDLLPLPDQSLFPSRRYFREKGFRELSIVTSRGCAGRCTFCQPTIQKMFGRKIRFHGSDYVVRQIRSLRERFRLDFFVISDDTFVMNKERVRKLCDKLIAEGADIFWRCQTRISLLDREIIRTLKRAGCFVVALGVESGSRKILDGLHKGLSVEKIREVFRICHEEGMLTHAYLMIGSIGENNETIAETERLLQEIRPFSSNICVTTPYPGTYLYEELEAKGLLSSRDWERYDHLLSDAVHLQAAGLDLDTLNAWKERLLAAQRYPWFKLRCLWKAFGNRNSLWRLLRVVAGNPGILVRGARLFLKSLFARGMEMSNPKTRAYRIYTRPKP